MKEKKLYRITAISNEGCTLICDIYTTEDQLLQDFNFYIFNKGYDRFGYKIVNYKVL